jgi:hypothetical protein
MSSLNRRIHFFTADLVYYESVEEDASPMSADNQAVFWHVSQLEWNPTAGDSAYQRDNDGFVALKIDALEETYVLGQLARSRRQGIPPVEVAGEVGPLELPENGGLFEAAHFGLFWDMGRPILAMEYNPYAPRQGRLGRYLLEKLRGRPGVFLDDATFTPIIRGDVLDQLLQSGPLVSLELSVVRDTVTDLNGAAQQGRLGAALKAQATISQEMQTVGIRLHRGRRRSGGAGERLKREIVAFISGNRASGITRAKAKVERTRNGKARVTELDLLADRWVHEVTVPRLENRGIDTRSMHSEIRRVYSEVGPSLVDELGKGNATTA